MTTQTLFSFGAKSGSVESVVVPCDRVQLASGEQFVVIRTHDDDGEMMSGPDGRPVYIGVSKSTGRERVILDREVTVHFRH